MQFYHPLMHNNFTKADMNAAIKILKNKNRILTQSKYVKRFEKKWSKWLGVKYSVFVNSGSSANLLTMTVLKILYGKGEIILPTLTWVSDVNSVIQNNLKPVFADINPRNLCMSEQEIIKKVLAGEAYAGWGAGSASAASGSGSATAGTVSGTAGNVSSCACTSCAPHTPEP